jgi:hypothetical protein
MCHYDFRNAQAMFLEFYHQQVHSNSLVGFMLELVFRIW